MKKKSFLLMLIFAFIVLFGIAQQVAATSGDGISAAEMLTLVEQLESEGAFANENAVRALTMHLTAVNHYEELGEKNKVIEHMNTFKLLLDHQLDRELQSEGAYNTLTENTNALVQSWENVVIINNQSAIVLDPAATETEKLAAEELQTYLLEMSGLELTVTDSVYETDGMKLYIGSAAPHPDLDRIRAGGAEPESFRLHVSNEFVQFVGLTDQGTLYAVYELLEQLGVRWFIPGELGTVIPELKNVKLRIQDTIQHPGYATRILAPITSLPRHREIPLVYDPTEGADWYRYTRQGGENFGKHGLPCPIKNTERPDLFMKENGTVTNQFDVTNPEVLECVVDGALKELRANPTLKYVSMGPNDGHGFGESEWDADDFDPMNGKISVTDRYIKFYNLVLDELHKEFPDVGIAFYAYGLDYRPPVREIPNPKIMPVLAPITFDRIHSIDNPLSWERQYFKDIIDGWKAAGVNEVMYRGYVFNLAEPGLPFSLTSQIKSEFTYFKQSGIERIRVEAGPAWGYHGPGLYLATKLMWDPTLDPEVILNDFFEKFYGPASEAMREHFTILEQAYEEADYFAGSAIDTPHILTKEVMSKMQSSLKQAEASVKGANVDPVYAKRVAMIRTAFDFGDHFLEMLDANNKHDFVKAKQHLDQVNELSMEAIEHSPVILYPYAQSYIKRFWGTRIMEGYNRVTDGNKIVAKMPDEWSVMLFPNGSGAELGLWKPSLGTESWMKLKTYSESWSDQGLRYYTGYAWYRTTIDVNRDFDTGNPIRLWFSNIDESAKVWLNGQELPLLKKGAYAIPWEFDATDAVQFGEPNVLVVEVGNEVLDELGSGGIAGPVMLWEVVTEPDTTAPSVPSDLTGEAISPNEIQLNWSPSTDNVAVAGYEIYRNSILIARVAENSFTDTDLEMGTNYRYTVRAFDENMNLSAHSSRIDLLTKFEGILLQDDFEDGNADGWTYNRGAWEVVLDEGNYVFRRTDDYGNQVAVNGHNEWSDYSLEVSIKPLLLQRLSNIHVYVRYTNSTNNYVFTYRHSTGELSLNKWEDGVQTLIEKTNFSMKENIDYRWKAVANGDTLELYIDDVLVLSASDPTWQKGRMNIKPSNTQIQFDDFLVTALNE